MALGALALIDPGGAGFGPPCPLRLLTGLDCPLCGATRATRALVHGDLFTALDHNALYVLALPFVGLLLVLWLVRGRLPAWSASTPARWSLAAVAIGFAIVRNLPFDAVSVLGSMASTN